MHDAALVDRRRRVDELLRRAALESKDCLASDGKISVRRNIVELTESDAVALRAGSLRTGAFWNDFATGWSLGALSRIALRA